ncbi:MAG: NAD(P)-dependent oxidoreductase [Dehalococcoidales bacterium]|nr:NAD(P)-dependent oxidoreductase [Dehalococcoidales bacterium]
MKVGFIGLGRMGGHMAGHILEAGYNLTVNDIRKEAADGILKKGAKWADTPGDMAGQCELIITSLPSPKEMQEVVYGTNGLMQGWKEGDIYVDMTTNSPAIVRQVARDALAKGVKVLDAPVTGGTGGAENGTLAIIAGGDKSALDKIHKVFEAMGTIIYHAGEVGCGNIAKLVNNIISITANSIMAEAFVLGVKAGIDPQVLWEVSTTGTANNWDLARYPEHVFKGKFEPGFRLSLASKDMGLAVQLGREYGVPLSVAAAVDQVFLAAKASGLGDKDIYSVFEYIENLSGVKVRTGKQIHL